MIPPAPRWVCSGIASQAQVLFWLLQRHAAAAPCMPAARCCHAAAPAAAWFGCGLLVALPCTPLLQLCFTRICFTAGPQVCQQPDTIPDGSRVLQLNFGDPQITDVRGGTLCRALELLGEQPQQAWLLRSSIPSRRHLPWLLWRPKALSCAADMGACISARMLPFRTCRSGMR